MLTYTIKKKPLFLAAMDKLGERWKNSGYLPIVRNIPAAVNATLEDEQDMPWNKIDFSRWYDLNVMGRFHVGDLVTWAYMADQVGFAPFHFKITYINEIHHAVKFSRKYQQPKCLIVQGLNGVVSARCPKELRLLTAGENALVNLQNTKAQGTA